ncbi:MAG: tRNA pseudouridine(38-40) synthase TruA [Pseudomonadota bacterium]
MARYALKIEYDGAPFAGWQRQADQPTVQGAIEAALGKLESDVASIGAAGRTDAGVHAWGQVAHCDLVKEWDPFRLSEALNYHLKPSPVAISACARAPTDDWHARFSALEREYEFRLVTRRAPPTLDAGKVWHLAGTLALAPMQKAAAFLIGRHDFTTFRSSICQAASPLKSVDEITITERAYPGGREFCFKVRARSFLHNQVRSFVGTLERVGAGAWRPEDVRAALEARDRSRCGPVCPPHGLALKRVGYPIDPFDQSLSMAPAPAP